MHEHHAEMKAECQAMMAKKQEMRDKLQAMDAELDKLVAEMNAAKESPMLIRTISLMGYTFAGLDGKMGKAEDFYFDDRHWAIRYVVAFTGQWISYRQVRCRDRGGQSTELYGTLGSVVLFLLWASVMARVLLIGGLLLVRPGRPRLASQEAALPPPCRAQRTERHRSCVVSTQVVSTQCQPPPE